ncbi:TetR/AcrR family transcriptional regulator [Nonomuraea typhae]|uniref:TetR/AcrR family transcriptional regulator n=1 Tax=Nonomuraea typhae TaxID=2603600 RepID=A0ABW7YWJ1_9ACTN
MTTEYAGWDDAERTLELLWSGKQPPRRGPAPKLTVPQIVKAAIELADAEGLETLSMRRVAELLGVGAMSLYTYVPGKQELIDVMMDTVLGEVTPAWEMKGDWRAKLERPAREDWALYLRYPWVLQITGHGRVLGPNRLTAFGSAMDALCGLGQSGDETITLIGVVDAYVRGMARDLVDAAEAERRTGVSDEQWWSTQIRPWSKHFDTSQYPTLADSSFAVSIFGEHEAKFGFGLQRVLDGIQLLVEARGSA